MKFMEAFEAIKTKLNGANTSHISDTFAIQINLINKDCGGAFYVHFSNGAMAVEPYDYRDNDAMLTAMYGDVNKILEGRMDPIKASETGTVKIVGNADKILAITGLVEPTPVAKKAASPKSKISKASTKTETVSKSKPAAKAKRSAKAAAVKAEIQSAEDAATKYAATQPVNNKNGKA